MSPLGILLAGAGTAAAILVGLAGRRRGGRRRAGLGRPGAGLRPAGRLVGAGRPRRASASRGARTASRPRTPSAGSTTSSGRCAPGPLRERLELMSGRLDDGVDESWRIARRGHEIGEAIGKIDTVSAEAELAELRRRLGPDAPSLAHAQTIEALEAQLASAHRLTALAERSRDRLRLLDARFDELLARTVEVSVGSGDTDVLGEDVDGLVSELEALRIAMDEAGRASRPHRAPSARPRRRERRELAAPVEPRRRVRHRAVADQRAGAHHRVRLRHRADRARRRLPDRQRDPEHRLRAAARRRALGDARPAVHLVRRARRRGVDERRGHA